MLVGRVGESLDRATAIGGPPGQTADTAFGLRRVRHAAAVWRPDRRSIEAAVECQASERFPEEIPYPDIVLLVAHVQRGLRTVRGDVHIVVRATRRRDRLLARLPIYPH